MLECVQRRSGAMQTRYTSNTVDPDSIHHSTTLVYMLTPPRLIIVTTFLAPREPFQPATQGQLGDTFFPRRQFLFPFHLSLLQNKSLHAYTHAHIHTCADACAQASQSLRVSETAENRAVTITTKKYRMGGDTDFWRPSADPKGGWAGTCGSRAVRITIIRICEPKERQYMAVRACRLSCTHIFCLLLSSALARRICF